MFPSVHRYGVCVPSRRYGSHAHVRIVKQIVYFPVPTALSSYVAREALFHESDDVLLRLLVALLADPLRGELAFVDRKLALDEQLFLFLVQLVLLIFVDARPAQFLVYLMALLPRLLRAGAPGRLLYQLRMPKTRKRAHQLLHFHFVQKQSRTQHVARRVGKWLEVLRPPTRRRVENRENGPSPSALRLRLVQALFRLVHSLLVCALSALDLRSA